MPEGMKRTKRSKGSPRLHVSDLMKARRELAKYKGFVAGLSGHLRLKGESDDDRLNSVVSWLEEKKAEKRNRKAAF